MIASIRGKKPHVYRVIILKQMAVHTFRCLECLLGLAFSTSKVCIVVRFPFVTTKPFDYLFILFSTAFKKEIYNICPLKKNLDNLISWLIEMLPPLLKTKHRQS